MTTTDYKKLSAVGKFEYHTFLQYLDDEIKSIVREFQNSVKYSERLYSRVTKLILISCPAEKVEVIFEKTSSTRLQLERLMQQEMLKYVELDFEVNPKIVAKTLVKATGDHPNVFGYKVFLLLANKGILAYLAKFDGANLKGFVDFRWCLQFIYYIKKFIIPLEQRTKIFLEDCERMFAILCAKCLMNEIEETGGKQIASQLEILKLDEASILQSLLFTVVDCTDPALMTTGNYIDRYVLSIFFESLGEIEESLAILKGALAEYECRPNVNDMALRVQKEHLNDMIRRYILSLTTKLEADPSTIRCMHKILEGLVLYGGVHMKIILFFLSLKEYYLKSSPATAEYSLDSKLTRECIFLLDRINKEWADMKNTCSSRSIQLPQVLLRSIFGELILVEEVFDENRPLEHHHDLSIMFSTMKFKVKYKCFAEVRTFKEYSNSMWECGMQWVNFWKECHLENHRELPPEIVRLFHGIK